MTTQVKTTFKQVELIGKEVYLSGTGHRIGEIIFPIRGTSILAKLTNSKTAKIEYGVLREGNLRRVSFNTKEDWLAIHNSKNMPEYYLAV